MDLTQTIRAHLNHNRSWRKLRRLQHEGPVNALRRWRVWSKILKTPPVLTEEVRAGAPVEVHMLCYEADYLCALWALKSFYHFARVRYPLAIHVQGSVPKRMLARLRAHFPAARIIIQSEADAIVERWLNERGLVRLIDARRRSPFMLKLTDFSILSEAVHLLTIDSDVVFFSRPSDLLVATEAPLPANLFQRDPVSTYNLSEERALDELGIRLAPQVNTGIMLFPRASIELSRCEQYLAHPDVAQPNGWIEQTLYALLASEQGRVTYLPDSYLISLETGVPLDNLIARHYAGPTRSLFTYEGLPELIKRGSLDQLRSSSRHHPDGWETTEKEIAP
jgi:hypothetical protein